MSNLKTRRPRQKSSDQKAELAIRQALERLDRPSLADSLSIFFTYLARAQREGDEEGVHEAHRAIAEAMRGVPDGPIDEPLLPALRKAQRKRRK